MNHPHEDMTSSDIVATGECKTCGFPVIRTTTDSSDPTCCWDYWQYCTNKTCSHHGGEGYGQRDLEWAPDMQVSTDTTEYYLLTAETDPSPEYVGRLHYLKDLSALDGAPRWIQRGSYGAGKIKLTEERDRKWYESRNFILLPVPESEYPDFDVAGARLV